MIDIETGLVVSAASQWDISYSNWRNSIDDLIAITNNTAARLLQNVTTTAGKQKIAIYVTKNSGTYSAKCVSSGLVGHLTNSGAFITVERTSDFLAGLQKEQRYQQSGNVDDNQLSRLGRQFGVNLVCVVDIISSGYITIRVINTETNVIMATSEKQGTSKVREMTTELLQQLVVDFCIKKDQPAYSSNCCAGLTEVKGICRDLSRGVVYWTKDDLGIEVMAQAIVVSAEDFVRKGGAVCPTGWRKPTEREDNAIWERKDYYGVNSVSYWCDKVCECGKCEKKYDIRKMTDYYLSMKLNKDGKLYVRIGCYYDWKYKTERSDYCDDCLTASYYKKVSRVQLHCVRDTK
jgi:hypothetical protein